MATHDYVIANGTGAAVRTDLNNALAAIVSNNSSSSAPATTYAYQWWADTSNNILKIRNSANNAWVELLQLDGTLTLEDGSNSAPALAFRDDLDTGIYSSAANTFNVATGGVERLNLGTTTIFNQDGADVDFRIEGDTNTHLFFLDAGNDRVGIDNASPATKLDVNGDVTITDKIIHSGDTNTFIRFPAADTIAAETNGSERLRLDSDGRILFGATSGNSASARAIFRGFAGDGGAGQGLIHLEVNKTTTNCGAGETLGSIRFASNEGHIGAQISASAETAWSGSGDLPTFIRFNTCPDGSNTMVERLRITSEGNVGVGQTVPQAFNHGSSGITTTKFEVQASTASASAFETATFRAGNDANGAAARLRIVHDNDRGLVIAGGRSSNAAFGSFSMTDQNGGIISSVHINNDGTWFWNKTAQSSATPGVELYKDGPNFMTRAANGGTVLGLNDSTGTNGDIMRFYYQDVHRGSLNFNGSNFAAVNASDYRLKENDTPISDGITRVKQLRPIRFNWKTDSSTIHDGFFAHEVQNVVPAAVIGEKDSTIGSRGEGYQMMSNEPLIPLLTAAIKELIVKVEALESA